MSAGTGEPQERPRWEKKFSQMFVFMLSAMKPNNRLGMSLAKERDFLSSAEGLDPEKDESFPDCHLCGPKGSWVLTVPPVREVGAGQLGSSCQQGVTEGVMETTARMGLGVPPTRAWCALLGHCSETPEGEKPGSRRGPQLLSPVPGAVGLRHTPPGRGVSPDLHHSQELSGFAGRMRESGRGGHGY